MSEYSPYSGFPSIPSTSQQQPPLVHQQQQQQQQLSLSNHYDHPSNSNANNKKRRLDSSGGLILDNSDLGGSGPGEEEEDKPTVGGGGGKMGRGEKPLKESKGGASEFVKKLYRMLEDGAFTEIVSWGFTGDTFVVKDMNSFTRSILPLHFKHSNFASFVRQLNKYDFHKVKNPEEGTSPYGEHTWEFKHPNFKSDMKSSLEHIRRKAPAARKPTPTPSTRRPNQSSPGLDSPHLQAHQSEISSLQNQIENLHRTQQGMSQHMSNLSRDYQAVMGEMMSFQRNMVAQDSLMQNLIQYLVNLEADQKAASNPTQDQSIPFVPSSQAQKLISSYTEVARASYDQMADLSRRASLAGNGLSAIPLPPPGFGHLDNSHHSPASGSNHSIQNNNNSPRQNPNIQGGDPRDSNLYRGPSEAQRQERQQQQRHHEQQQQRSHQQLAQNQLHQSQISQLRNENQIQHPNAVPLPLTPTGPGGINIDARIGGPPGSSGGNGNSSSGKRPTYVPGWAVPPRVLLVEDDAVCRKLSSKFLQVFGCSIDVAVDGVSAVNKMNLEKYDLVLMDIVMPNLDGVSATSLIRQFDPMTPIISMTSNSGPNDIMTYFSHGMNDILPKPFTKEGLLGMLEKHLIHLKVMQQVAEIPRALGFTDNQIQDALATSAVSDEGTVLNPFSSMGISDGDYLSMLQKLGLQKEGKTGLEVVGGRFEISEVYPEV